MRIQLIRNFGLLVVITGLASVQGQSLPGDTYSFPTTVYQPGIPAPADAPQAADAPSPAMVPAVAAPNVEPNPAPPAPAAPASPLAMTKGDFTITPYGILWANMVEESGRTTPGNFPFYVARPRANENDDFYIDARSTRLGIDILGPRIPFFDCARSGGKVEIDFQRQIDSENKPSVLLRHAYVEVKNDDFRLLFGQTWDVISPLSPGMLAYSPAWDAGNIGYRRPQLRGERYLPISDTFAFVAQGSLDTISPTDTSGSSTTYTAVSSGWPIIEGRLAVLLGQRGQGCLPAEFGVSSHVGELIYDFSNTFRYPGTGVPVKTWSLNADAKVPFTEHFGVQGEMFMGQALGPFLGCDGQTADVTGITGGATPTGTAIRSRGGWFDVWYDWTPRLHSHVGYSIDDPFDEDVTSGRIYNSMYFANISYDLTKKFLTGFEYSNWKTIWDGPSVTAVSNNFNFVVKYSF